MNRKKKQQALIEKAYGTEPVWHNVEFESDEQRSEKVWRAKNWYRERTTSRDKKKWTLDYVKTLNNEELRKSVSAVSIKMFSETVAFLCRCNAQGLSLTASEKSTINDELCKLKELGAEALKNQKPKKTIQERIQEQIDEYCGMVNEVTDRILDQISTRKSVTFNMNNWLTAHKVKSVQARQIAEYLRPTLDEILEALEGKDPQLVEGYDFLTKPMLKKWARILSSLITACEDHAMSLRTNRKPRKKKVKTAAQLVSKVKYQKDSDEFKLKSIEPSNIIGATTLLVFNTKYRQLTVYRSSDVTGFGMKGTTLQNFDPSNSETKTVRKPETLSSIQGIRSFNSFWKDIKTKAKTPSGRLNDNTIIMKAYT
tara:strand:- start:5953 stop:7059 length:1107 start_codon:yes stop_codon:yes gene_type:complete